MSQLGRFLYPNYRHWVDIYITAAPASMLSIQLLKDIYVSAMEIPITVIPSLGRHIYHSCTSLYAEHTIIERHLCLSYGDSYTRNTVIGSKYISQMSKSLCWAYKYWNTYAPGMEIPIPELPSLGRHIYHRCVSLYAEHTIIGPHLWPTYGDSYTRIALVGSTYISQMRQSLCWAYNYWNTPMTHLWRFLYPNCPRWVDIYITDASVSMLSIQILEHTCAPGMEIPIPELPSLGRHIYHRCVSLYAEHTVIGTHLCSGYGNSYTRITVIGSTYISQMRQSLC